MPINQHAALDAKLDALNQAVEKAIHARTVWMNEHMKDYAKFQIGDEIYDERGYSLGTVTEHYRYHAGDPRFDTSMFIHYRYRTPGGYNDNTSRQIGVGFYTREEAERNLRYAAERLRNKNVERPQVSS